MKVWIDVLTPKQVLFFEPLVRKLESRGIKVLVTSRDFKEAADLIKQKKLGWKIVGLYGGGTLKGKLKAELDRNQKLLPIITRFKPDYALGSASPSMVRMAFGLGIPILLHSNTPHADKTMRLAVPLAEHLFIPGHIPKHAFIHYGIHPDKITQYDAMDEIVWSQKLNSKLYLPNDIILVRLGETKATYHVKKFDNVKFLRDLSEGYPGRKIVVLPRYADERKLLKTKLKQYKNIIIEDNTVDSSSILDSTSVFIGSGGTMTTEAALRGIPTISLNITPNKDEEFLLFHGFITRDITKLHEMLESKGNWNNIVRLNEFIKRMEDPHEVIIRKLITLETKGVSV